MNNTPPSQDTNDSVDKAYEASLEKALHQAKQTDTGIHQSLDDVQGDLKAPDQLGTDESGKLIQSIKRDLTDAAHHLNETGKELKDWLGFDLLLIKNELWKNFTEAADKTTLELMQLKQIAANAEYHTGEIIGLGTLVCDSCSASLHFHKPGHIPPCAKCHGTKFHRQNR